MADERWAKLKDAFEALVELSRDEQRERVAVLASTDPELSRRLEALLAADASADALLEPLEIRRCAVTEAEAGDDPSSAQAPASSAVEPFGLSGCSVSHFRVGEVLGCGGMGVVYRAEDMRLGRTVALKFLLPQYSLDAAAKQRFLREARAASALDHPNVCTVHEVGESEQGQLFLAMGCYSGETLRARLAREGPLPVAEALEIARQALLGLGAAHDGGIVHRDLKPANLMCVHDGTVKVLDFGLAMVRVLQLTDPEHRPGTVAYMSPEQIQGDSLDQRTDLWSLGVVLYEMLTGLAPFGSRHDLSTVYSILHEEPVPPSTRREEVPQALDQLVGKLLRKQTQERYAIAAEVLADLETVAPEASAHSPDRRRIRRSSLLQPALLALVAVIAVGGTVAALMDVRSQPVTSLSEGQGTRSAETTLPSTAQEVASIAVLPFADLSPERDQEYFVEGIAAELINHLSKVDGLKVAARSSTIRFKGGDLDVREVASRLGVAYVLEGSVRKAGDRLRITVQLVSAENGYELWSETYERQISDVFVVQEEISRAIAGALNVRLAAQPVARRLTEEEAMAYDLYLRGRDYLRQHTSEGTRQAAESFRKALALDPTLVRAYTGLADIEFHPSPAAPGERFRRARAATARAVALDSTLAEPHVSMAWIAMWYDRDWAAAERHLQHAFELDPSYPTTYNWYAAFLSATGKLDEALVMIRRAYERVPSPANAAYVGARLLWLGQPEAAMEYCEGALSADPALFLARWCLGRAYVQLGRFDDAILEFQHPGIDYLGIHQAGYLGYTYAQAGQEAEARRVLRALRERISRGEYVAPTELAVIHIGLGEREQALDWLERHEADRGARIFLKVDPIFDSVRSDRRFTRILRRLGLE
jgi:serine/threonine protein kinase/Tfp pilus assembly protein PilF